ncbi:MAG: hypothetical protein S4CHLAM45_10750 [Chlamydiales bacterium]|nr:hypothetical protein [Chlamydiales bacterium]MCH9619568.1 hypothetical protein [Chlamydiales bacterium]MCH9623174.1 hypothetical protein [Chlamydiales bacterium]
MADDIESGLRKSIEELLELYDIKLDDSEEPAEEVDYAEVLIKTQEKIDDLEVEAEKIYEATGMSKEELEEYSNNPDNFTKEQWEMLQQVRSECEEFKKKAYALVPNEALEQVAEPAPVARKKKKSKFAKKKDWLQS